MHLRNDGAAALLRRVHGDLAPVLEAFPAARRVELHDAARYRYRPDAGHAEFHGLLDGQVHLLVARQRLHERHGHGRLGHGGHRVADMERYGMTRDGIDARGELAAVTVEHLHGIARARA